MHSLGNKLFLRLILFWQGAGLAGQGLHFYVILHLFILIQCSFHC